MRFIICSFVALLCMGHLALGYTVSFPTAPAAGQPGSTAIGMNNAAFSAWADGYTTVQYGSNVDAQWKVPANALGQAEGTVADIVCLGRGGQITLTFSQGITDGTGHDFAVFENGISEGFLELAWVEVSSDGIHFVRFPNFSDTPAPIPGFGTVNPIQLYGLASKYHKGHGTPFDLSELIAVSNSIAVGGHNLTAAYVSSFNANIGSLDITNVQYVRIIDIVGDGNAYDCEGYKIYDPYPTIGSAGFDLDAIGVINQPAITGDPQSISFDPIPNQKLTFGSASLNAASDSGLPVSFTVQSGPATVTNNFITFSSTGVVEVVANQSGDATYAPAPPVLQSFQVAEEIQHIFIEPVPNQVRASGSVQVNAYASSGLPVKMEVFTGPPSVFIDEDTHLLSLGSEAGQVTLRALQSGDANYAPAADLFMGFDIVETGSSNAPITLTQWATTHAVPSDGLTDSDNDGVVDFQEFVLGGDPNYSNDVPRVSIEPSKDKYNRSAISLSCTFNRLALANLRYQESSDLENWTNAVPEITEYDTNANTINMKVNLTTDDQHHYYRLQFNEQ